MICKGCGAVIARRNTGFGVWRWLRLDDNGSRLYPWVCKTAGKDHAPREVTA